MNQIKSKVYYEIATGNILTITSEMEGTIEETTKDQDMTIYPELQDKNVNDIDFIELEYGTLASIFQGCKTFKIDLESRALKCEYFTDEELQAIKDQYENDQYQSDRTEGILNYLTEKNDMIPSVEDYIMQAEINKITEGMN